MGDINLLGMIRKIKNSISGFVSTSDKATKSKFGIVKIGDGINVASGVISVTGGGFTKELLFAEGETPVALAKDETVTLAHSYSDYKMICVILRRNNDGYTNGFFDTSIKVKQLVPYVNATGNYSVFGTSFDDATPTTLKIADVSNPSNMYIAYVYGYK